MPTLQEILHPHVPDRRAVGRTPINRGVLMHFAGCDGVHGCCVRDITNLGVAIRLNFSNVTPTKSPSRHNSRHRRIVRKLSNEMPNSEGMMK
jgi:hypothetical protein